MAVYEQAYGPFLGERTAGWSRFLIIPRYAYQDIFRSKLVTGLFAVSFVYPLVAAILVYLRHNPNALAILSLAIGDLISINGGFFRTFVAVQARFAFLLTLFVGPALIARDLANNALPLYLSRPFSRAEYVLGKLAVLFILLSGVTWVPGLLIFLLQAYLEGWQWFVENLSMGAAIFVGSWVWILLMALLALAISAVVKWNIAARALLFGILIIPGAMGGAVNHVFETRWGSIVNMQELVYSIWVNMFRTNDRVDVPAGAAWVAIALIWLACLGLLARKVRAYEVVR